MSSVDNRVVNMEFNNRDFATKIAETMLALSKLDKALQFEKGQVGLDNVASAANNMDFSGMEAGIQALNNRFSTLGIVGMTVISKITGGIMDFGRKIAGKAISGGISRAMGLEHAAFMMEGIMHNAKQEAAVMEDVKASVDGTAYSLDQAANVAAQFVATGMKSGNELRTILKGVTGISAVFEADYQRVGEIFTQVGAQNRVYANDLNSLATMGVNAKAALADYYKEVKHQSNVTVNTIDEMVKKGEIDFKTFGNAMAYAFGDQAKQANRTFSGAMSNVNAHLAQIGEKFVRPFIAAKESLDSTKNSTYNLVDILNSFRLVIDRVRDTLGDLKVYDNWSKGVNKVSEVITKFLNVIATDPNKGVLDFIKNIESLQKALGMNDKDFKNLVDTVFGIIDAFKIVKNVVVDFINAILPAGSSISSFGSGLLEVTGSIGRFITNLRDASDKTTFFADGFNLLGKIFSGIGIAIKAVIGVVGYFASKILGIATSIDSSIPSFKDFESFIDAIGEKLKPLANTATNVFGKIKNGLDGIFDEIGKAISGASYSKFLEFLNIGLTGGIGVSFITFINNMTKTLKTFADSISVGLSVNVRGLESLISTLNFSLQDLQKNIKANTILQIAKAIALLAGSVFLLSIINPERLFTALSGLQVLLLNVMEIVSIINKMSATGVFNISAVSGAIVAISASLIIMAAAVKILSTIPFEGMILGLGAISLLLFELDLFLTKTSGLKGRAAKKAASALLKMSAALILMSVAVKQLGSLSMEALAKGLIGIGAVLAEMAAFTFLTQKLKVGKAGAIGLLAMSAALIIIAKVVKSISKLNPERLAKGLVGLGFILLELAAFIKITSGSKGILKASVGMFVLSKALEELTAVLKTLGNFSEEEIAKGLLTLGGSLLIIAGSMRAMPSNMLAVSAGLFIAAQAIKTITEAMASMGGMSPEAMAKSLVVMAGALAILAIAMNAMNSAVAGAAAMIIAAAALALLVPPLIALGNMPLEAIVVALLGIAGVFTVLGVAGAVLGPVLPIILGLSVAVGILGAGMVAAGVGIMVFVTALALVATNVELLVQAIPVFIAGLTASIASIATFATQLIMALLKGISNNIGKIVALGIQLVVNFINGVSSKIGDVVDAGLNLIVSFIEGIANGIDEHGEDLLIAIGHLTVAIVNFVVSAFESIVGMIPGFGDDIVAGIESIKSNIEAFFKGGSLKKEAESSANEVADATDKGTKKAKDKAKKNLGDMPKISKKALKDFGAPFNELPGSINGPLNDFTKNLDVSKKSKASGKKTKDAYIDSIKDGKYKETGKGIGNEVVSGASAQSLINDMKGSGGSLGDGYTEGIKAKWDDAYNAAYTMGLKAKQGEKDATKHSSPSKVFFKAGQFIGQGYVNGMTSFFSKVYRTGKELGLNSVEGVSRTVNDISKRISSGINTTPTIRPVMDLSGVKMGVDSIDSMMNANQYAIGIAGSIPTNGLLTNRNVTFNNTITVDGTQNPRQFADEFVQELELQARTI